MKNLKVRSYILVLKNLKEEKFLYVNSETEHVYWMQRIVFKTIQGKY